MLDEEDSKFALFLTGIALVAMVLGAVAVLWWVSRR